MLLIMKWESSTRRRLGAERHTAASTTEERNKERILLQRDSNVPNDV
jgi:hypothetical protein